ncbi:hypothetical protein LCGC14_2192880, partial [marine sediment metagenome]
MPITIKDENGDDKLLTDIEATALCQAASDEHWAREFTYTSKRDDPNHKAHPIAKKHTIDVSTVVF